MFVGFELDAPSLLWGSVGVLTVGGGCSGLGFDGGGWGWVGVSGLLWWGVTGFTEACCWCFGVVLGCGGVVFLVLAGFLGGVGVDLVWGLGACKVIRVAAADAER